MKIVAISDLHGYLPTDLPDGDVLCIAGDIAPSKIQRDVHKCLDWLKYDFKQWAESLNFDKVIFTAGNHDFVLYDSFNIDFNSDKIVYLQDKSYEYKGKVFYGTPWIADLSNWAFYADESKLKMAWDLIPNNCDVLITHMPPKIMNYGTVLETYYNTGNDYGSESLFYAVQSRNIKYHVFGHVHSGDHEMKNIGGTNYSNVSLKGEDYIVKYKPCIFEI